MKKAFTIIELIFVIVILGILSAVALPKFATTKNLADVSKARSDVAAIRSSILTERQSQLIKGNIIDPYIPKLSENSTLFTGVGVRKLLRYGIVEGSTDGKWSADDTGYKKYTFHSDSKTISFEYDSSDGTFNCITHNTGDDLVICKKIVN